MKNKKTILAMCLGSVFALFGCNDEETLPPSTDATITVNLTKLTPLGGNYRYEGWLIVDGQPHSTGTFTAQSDGTPSQNLFVVDKDIVRNASSFVLTVEPNPDTDPAPSSMKILAGDFQNNSVEASVSHPKALGVSFGSAAGTYILATPTDGDDVVSEKSGIWFLRPNGGSPQAGLTLPAPPAGWEYEGWVNIDGTLLSTGKFTSASAADRSVYYSDVTASGPPFPGEDFLINAPTGLTFPLELDGNMAFISLEPVVGDDTTAPSFLRPLEAVIPKPAQNGMEYSMENNTSEFPTGVVYRENIE